MTSIKEFELAPDPSDEKLTRRVKGIDHNMKTVTTSVTVERPLTLFLNSREIKPKLTTPMAIPPVNTANLCPSDPKESK